MVLKSSRKDIYMAILDIRYESEFGQSPTRREVFTTIELADELGSWIGEVGSCLRIMQAKGQVKIVGPGQWQFCEEY